MIALRLWIIISSVLFAPAFAHATACEDIPEQIKHDIDRYGSTLANHHLPWMCLTWLQQKMGHSNAKPMDNHQMSHTWECANGSNSKLTVLTDNNDNIIQVNGQYSSEQGAAVFSAPINTTCSAKNNSVVTSPITDESNPKASCDATAEQIYDIALMSIEHPYTHPPFPWEDKSWLETTFGTPKIITAATNISYIWHCQKDVMTTVTYSEIPQGPTIQLATLCKGSNCYLATISRNKNSLDGSLKIIAPKPS